MTGPVGQPLRAGASVIDILGAVFGVVAAQAALREREQTGKGQRVGSALFESAAFLMSTHMAGMAATGLEARPMPARRGAWAIYEVFKTAEDGQLFIGVTSDQQWTRFVEEFSLQDLAADPRLATNVMRLQERTWLIPALQQVLAKYPQQKSKRAANARTCPGPKWASQVIFSPTRIFWRLAACWTFSSLASVAWKEQKVGLPALPIEFGQNRDRPGIRRQSPASGRTLTGSPDRGGVLPRRRSLVFLAAVRSGGGKLKADSRRTVGGSPDGCVMNVVWRADKGP